MESFVSKLVTAGVRPLSCGGDHSLLLPLLKAVRSGQSAPLSMIHVDAHTGTHDALRVPSQLESHVMRSGKKVSAPPSSWLCKDSDSLCGVLVRLCVDTWDDLWGEPDHHGSPVRRE